MASLPKLKGQSYRSDLYVNRPLRKQAFQRPIYIQKPDDFRHPAFQLAEREGFEPPDPLRSTVFKTAAFDHSAISPILFPNWDLLLLVALPFRKGLQRYE